MSSLPSGASKHCHQYQKVIESARQSTTLINTLVDSSGHLQIGSLREDALELIIPKNWTKCYHLPLTDSQLCIGHGAFGAVYCLGGGLCAKKFGRLKEFCDEAVMLDLVTLAKIRSPENAKGAEHIVPMYYPCTKCKCIVFPRYISDLSRFDLTETSIDEMCILFTQLADGVQFLNEQVGLVHCDISPSNILVEAAHMGGVIHKLVLNDLGIACFHGGNKKTNIILKSTKGKTLSVMYSPKLPICFCKDKYKPAFILFICYTAYTNLPSLVLSQSSALTLDRIALGYTLMACIHKKVGLTTHNDVFEEMWPAFENELAFLMFLIHKVALRDFLSHLWGIDLGLGVDTRGRAKYTTIPAPHRVLFRQYCPKFTDLYNRDLERNPDIRSQLMNSNLSKLVTFLTHPDWFGPPKRRY